ncbi:MAG: heme o synthase [Myxococcota bacterium]
MESAHPALDRPSSLERLAAYKELSKPNLTHLVVVTAVFGYWLASVRMGWFDWPRFLFTIVGTWLTSAGACASNMVIEGENDRKMRRTQGRPIPSGRVSAGEAGVVAALLFVTGFLVLALGAGWLPAGLSLATLVFYAVIYTPLKRRGGLAIALGAVPGALPPVIGWSAAQGSLDWGALILFVLLFAWQYPHFLALAYIYRQDYARGGFEFIPLSESERRTGIQMSFGCQLAVLASLFPVLSGLVGPVYAVGAGLAGGAFCTLGVQAALHLHAKAARAVFLGSIAYLPALLLLTVVDHVLR